MNKSKGLIIALVASLIMVMAMAVYIVLDKNKEKREASVTTEVTTSEVASDNEDQEDESADENKSEDASSKTDAYKDNACYAKITDTGNWQEGDKFVHQYSVDICNESSDQISDWEVKISGFKGAKLGDSWNAELKIDGDTLSCTSMDYNKDVPGKNTTNFGFQAKFDSSDAADVEKIAELFVGGKKSEVKKEEPTTLSEDEKKEVKKEKKKAEKGSPLENHGKLSIKGTDIVDKNGDKYQLKGVSTHGIAWFPDYVNKDAFKTLRDDWGANLIRIAMYTGENGGYCQDGNKDNLKKLVDDGVSYATELGLYVIIDWHILSDNNPHINESEAVAFFDEMSSKYADYDNVLYEICNEPNGGTSWSDIKSYAETVIPAIRNNDKDGIIIVGTPTWSQDVDMAAEDPITGQENIAYTTHFYAATHKENIREKVKKAHDKGLCVFISEFSICEASGNGTIDYDSADDWFKMIDDYNLSYAGWNLSNKDEASALLSPDCKSTSGWSDDDLSDTGKWLKNQILSD
ncbi:MAG: cellulase family glycosylhydrolase [Eubacterium sp.]|nr:cellulase family glycosylhydrolase [Eubacterium sp.]